jgi:hypothetical protein
VTHLFLSSDFLIQLSSFFHIGIGKERWDTKQSVQSDHAGYAGNGFLQIIASGTGRRHVVIKNAKENGMQKNVLSGIKRIVPIFSRFT